MIPRLVHRVWLGGEEPEWCQPFAETWEQPGWEVIQWNEPEVEALFPLINQDIYDRAEQIAPDRVGQLRSDVLRYEILRRFGGVYVDADFECLRPLDELIAGAPCFAAWERQDVWIANGLIGAVPGHSFISGLIHGIPASVRYFQFDRVDHRAHPTKLTGPQYLTRQYRAFGALARMRVLPQALIYPYGYAEVEHHGLGEDWGDAYTVHHWHNKRRERGCPVSSRPTAAAI